MTLTPPTAIHQTTNPKHREDYVFVEKPGEDFTALKLMSGPYASIVYKYGNVGFRPESEANTNSASDSYSKNIRIRIPFPIQICQT